MERYEQDLQEGRIKGISPFSLLKWAGCVFDRLESMPCMIGMCFYFFLLACRTLLVSGTHKVLFLGEQ